MGICFEGYPPSLHCPQVHLGPRSISHMIPLTQLWGAEKDEKVSVRKSLLMHWSQFPWWSHCSPGQQRQSYYHNYLQNNLLFTGKEIQLLEFKKLRISFQSIINGAIHNNNCFVVLCSPLSNYHLKKKKWFFSVNSWQQKYRGTNIGSCPWPYWFPWQNI